MRVLESIAEVRAACDAARREHRTVGLVPTMGYFHAGHRSLMETARAENDVVVVSLFVNPTQFGPTEDLAAYPQDPDGDVVLATDAGVDVLFRPSLEEMYPNGTLCTSVHVTGLSEGMCGAARPTHFDGVATVVAKLFSIAGPCRAYFGRKDFQQLAIVRRMATDLDLPVTVVGVPLVRESDGLALSSRNAYLSETERAAAPVLFAALIEAADSITGGERNAAVLAEAIRSRVATEPMVALEYVEVRDAELLGLVEDLGRSASDGRGEVVIAVAAQVGRARLIDNVVVTIGVAGKGGAAGKGAEGVTVDEGVRVGTGGPPTATNP